MLARKIAVTSIVFALALPGISHSQQSNIYVDAVGGSDSTTDATNWAGAWRTLQKGIDDAASRQKDFVLVAEGTYGSDQMGGTQIALASDVSVRGGYIAGGSTDPLNPDGSFLNTIISGFTASGSVVRAVGIDNSELIGFVVQGGSALNGGGLFSSLATSGGFVEVREVIFQDNVATSDGGGVFHVGGTLEVDRCSFTRNQAPFGAAVCLRATSPELPNSTLNLFNAKIHHNGQQTGALKTQFGGGIIAVGDTEMHAANCLIDNNKALVGGGICLIPSSEVDEVESEWTITQCTISKNRALNGTGAGLHITPSGSSAPGVTPIVDVFNTILWGNQIGLDYYRETPAVTPDFDVHIWYTDLGTSSGTYDALDNISENPKFVSPAARNFRLKNPPFNPSLASPCLDRGHEVLRRQDKADVDEDGNVAEKLPLDLDLNTRVVDLAHNPPTGDEVDMGAYENQGSGIGE